MKTKVCRICDRRRAVTKFHMNREKKDGYAIYCKDCLNEKKRAAYQSNKGIRDRARDRAIARRQRDPEAVRVTNRQSYQKHRIKTIKKVVAREKKRRKEDPAWRMAWGAWKNHKARDRVPSWAVFADTETVYRQLYTEYDPRVYVVDHIVPVNGVLVCGLHTRDNLQIITKKENGAKGNEWEGIKGPKKFAHRFLKD